MHYYLSRFRYFYHFYWLILTPILSMYAGGVAALLWCGLSVFRVRWSTFIVFNIEFHNDPVYNTLLTVSWIAFCIPIVIALLIAVRRS